MYPAEDHTKSVRKKETESWESESKGRRLFPIEKQQHVNKNSAFDREAVVGAVNNVF